MFTLLDGREELFQWDKDRYVIVNDLTIHKVHFCNRTSDCSLGVEVKDGLAAIPNILLQTDLPIRVYAYCDDGYTKVEEVFKVKTRTKPADYIYTETDIYTVEKAVNDALEKAEVLEKTKEYINQELSNTKEYINQGLSNIDENKVNTSTEKYIVYGRDAKGERAIPYAALSAKAASVPLRTDEGCIFTEAPTSNKHAANKKYVDDAIAAVSGLPLQNNGGLVINDGSANGSYSIAGGTTDEEVIENLAGSTAASLANVKAAEANGDMSISYGVDTITETAGTTAIGVASMAGAKGYYWHSINFTNKTITLSKTRKTSTTSSATAPTANDPKWSVGDYISIRNKDRGYGYCSKITKVSGNVITVDSLPFDRDLYTSFSGLAPYDRTIYAVYQENYLGQSKVKRWRCRGGTVDLGFGSLATGMQNAATGIFSEVSGRGNLAAGDYAHAEGRVTIASGEGSHAEGQRTIANGYAAHAEGTADSSTNEWVIASGDGAHAEGYAGEASGNYAHKEGHKSTASGGASHAEGDQAQATNWAAHAEGQETKARGIASHAEGLGSIANGNYAHAEGEYTIANGSSSHAAGIGTAVGLNNKNGCTIVGRYGTANENSLFAVAGGTSADNKKLVFEVTTDGSIIINSSTPNSTARFRLTVNDDGVLTTTRI